MGEDMKRKNILMMEIICLLIVGLCMIYSSSYVWAEYKFDDPLYFFKRQFVFAIIGVIIMFFVSRVDINRFKKYNNLILIFSFLSLILVLVPEIGVLRNGSRSWFSIFSFLVQPSEFFKIALILYTSDYMAKQKRVEKIKHFFKPLLFMILGFLIILLQPDFGSGVVMVCSVVVILFCAKVPIKYFIYLMLSGASMLVALILSAPYRLERILSFLDPFADPLGSGFQIIQSLYAIGPAGLFGRSYTESIQKSYYLPEPQTDFIFAIFAEEFGFIGCFFLIMLFILIIYEGIQIALNQEDVYKSYVSIGVISLFTIQVMINLGVVVGLFPVTGITLPLISYGGSSMLVMLVSFGILISNAKK